MDIWGFTYLSAISGFFGLWGWSAYTHYKQHTESENICYREEEKRLKRQMYEREMIQREEEMIQLEEYDDFYILDLSWD